MDQLALIDRRGFVCACAAAGLTLAGCAISDATAPNSIGASLRVADYSGLASVGGVALVTLNGSPLAIVRTGDTSFEALSRICPHQGATVNYSGAGFTCPRHGARFTIDGAWSGRQPTSSLHSYSTSYDPATGMLTVG
jgi:Rieske Fe-S protein